MHVAPSSSATRLLILLRQHEWEQAGHVLDSLSNTEMRRMERAVREEILPQLNNDDFWEAYLYLIIYKRASFLSAIRAIRPLAASGQLRFDSDAALRLADTLPEAQALKLVDMALPQLNDAAQIEALFQLMHINDEHRRVALLIRIDTPLCYYLLFQTLTHLPDHRAFAFRCYRFLLRRQNDMAFNMASILRSYFGLSEAQEQLSLRIEPYELSYIDHSYENFLHVLNGKRPQL